jgi:hypothetical protein
MRRTVVIRARVTTVRRIRSSRSGTVTVIHTNPVGFVVMLPAGDDEGVTSQILTRDRAVDLAGVASALCR